MIRFKRSPWNFLALGYRSPEQFEMKVALNIVA
jgi:hypothetical protein